MLERLTQFFQLLKTSDAKAKMPINLYIIKEFRETKQELDRCCQLAQRQPLTCKRLVLMTDACFQAAGYAVLTEDDPNQNDTSTPRTYDPIAYIHPSQIKKATYAKKIINLSGLQRIRTYILGCDQTSDYYDR